MEETYTIIGLNCAHCGSKIEEAINKLDEIESAVLNFPMKTLKIKGNISDDTLEKINKTAGKIEAGVKIVPKIKLQLLSTYTSIIMNTANAAAVTVMNTLMSMNTIIPTLTAKTKAIPVKLFPL